MLELDDVRWKVLKTAFGHAGDVPEKLYRFLACPVTSAGSLNDPDDLLFGSLCHQGCSIYTATYAAVPHIVDRAKHLSQPDRWWLLAFAGAVAAAPDAPSEIPDFLQVDYKRALCIAIELVHSDILAEKNSVRLLYLLGSFAALRGMPEAYRKMTETAEELETR